MTNSGLTAGDVLALTKNDGMDFGGVGGFILLFIFLMAIGGNGFGFGGNAGVSQMATADLLYNQSTDSAIRGLAQGQCGITDAILNASYNNLLANKDIATQIANQTAVLTNVVNSNSNNIMAQMQTNVIDELRDKLQTTRDSLSNERQTAQITQNILGSLATTNPKPPCYYGCGCGCNGLY